MINPILIVATGSPANYILEVPSCPCCCSAYMVETESGWVCPVCGAIDRNREDECISVRF